MKTTIEQRTSNRQMSRDKLANLQVEKLNGLLERILPDNRFYDTKLGGKPQKFAGFDEFTQLPYTYKEELAEISGSEFAANLTYPIEEYVRLHRTSGTRGRPLVVLDTAKDWEWWMDAWQYVLDAADINQNDRVVTAFSFGPFIGFWSAYDAVHRRGALVAPAGGMNTPARIEMIRSLEATVIFCTPSYAIHMAQVASEHQTQVADTSVKTIVVAGEPGGNIPAVREQIELAWDARVIDHAGASEVGPWGFADPDGRGLYVNEIEFIAEFISIESGQPAEDGELSELVLTTLGRDGCPVIRYRTGDLTRPTWNHQGKCNFVLLDGGVLGRVDDMMIVRGVNIFPSSIEQILRSFPEIIEYRMTALKEGAMDRLKIEIEDRLNEPGRVASELQLRLGLKVEVESVAMGTLPRFELKGNRFIDER